MSRLFPFKIKFEKKSPPVSMIFTRRVLDISMCEVWHTLVGPRFKNGGGEKEDSYKQPAKQQDTEYSRE